MQFIKWAVGSIFFVAWLRVHILYLQARKTVEYDGPFSKEEVWLHQRYPVLWGKPEDADMFDLIAGILLTPIAEIALVFRQLRKKQKK